MTEQEFIKLRRPDRLAWVKEHGEYLGSRGHGGHRAHLYRLEGFFVEVWMRIGLAQVEWIEVARNTEVLSEYVRIDVRL